MLDFLTGIVDVILSLLQLVINFIMSLVQLIVLSVQFVAYLTNVLAFFPAPLMAFAGLGISLSVILLLVGRNS